MTKRSHLWWIYENIIHSSQGSGRFQSSLRLSSPSWADYSHVQGHTLLSGFSPDLVLCFSHLVKNYPANLTNGSVAVTIWKSDGESHRSYFYLGLVCLLIPVTSAEVWHRILMVATYLFLFNFFLQSCNMATVLVVFSFPPLFFLFVMGRIKFLIVQDSMIYLLFLHLSKT